jgi:hypothetical protein
VEEGERSGAPWTVAAVKTKQWSGEGRGKRRHETGKESKDLKPKRKKG